jgi:hypothetical protein
MPVLASLPRIVRFLGTSDAGGPDAECPHCGAKGRYVHSFECEDGSRRGAMSGCVKLFPVHPIAQADMALRGRERELRTRFGATAQLNSWDQRMRVAIDAYYAGTMTEGDALVCLRTESQSKANWRRAKRGRW